MTDRIGFISHIPELSTNVSSLKEHLNGLLGQCKSATNYNQGQLTKIGYTILFVAWVGEIQKFAPLSHNADMTAILTKILGLAAQVDQLVVDWNGNLIGISIRPATSPYPKDTDVPLQDLPSAPGSQHDDDVFIRLVSDIPDAFRIYTELLRTINQGLLVLIKDLEKILKDLNDQEYLAQLNSVITWISQHHPEMHKDHPR